MRFLLFLVSLLLSALLFAVQPMASKMLLPVLGGTPAVWTTAMFTFQLLLLGGYFYAHGLVHWLKPVTAWVLHTILFIVSLTLLPIVVTLTSSDALLASPAPHVMRALIIQLGLPFLLLSATQPLLQSWLARSNHPLAKHPHVLYSASNLGSFIGLIGYVVLAEPMLNLHAQRLGWSVVYIVGLLLTLAVGGTLVRMRAPLSAPQQIESSQPLRWQQLGAWVGLAFLASSLSLGVTTYVTTDIASMPLIWVIPLSLYLLSFVDAFSLKPKLVSICQRLGPLVGAFALLLYVGQMHRFSGIFVSHFMAFGVLAVALHGWLAAMRPSASKLTAFYLAISVGGALGGLLNGLLAPLLLDDALEYPMMLVISMVVLQMLLGKRMDGRDFAVEAAAMWRVLWRLIAGTCVLYGIYSLILHVDFTKGYALLPLQMAVGVSVVALLIVDRSYSRAVYTCAFLFAILIFGISQIVNGQVLLFKDRNFFGIERVSDNLTLEARFLTHDTTVHGIQSLRADDRLAILSYYASLGEVFERLPRLHSQRLATVGLGIGSTKCYLRPKQWMDFYEINPMVQQLAGDGNYFTMLRDCPGEHRVLLGDGRIRLAQEPDGQYGMLVLDAFSSDAIPAHLLTQEALKLYFSKLAPKGILLMHTTNRHIDLWPVIGAHADALGYTAYGKEFTYPDGARLTFHTFWVVMARDEADLVPLVSKQQGWQRLHGDGGRVWTDDYVSILPYLKVVRGDSSSKQK